MNNFIKVFILTISFIALLSINFLVFDIFSIEELMNALPKLVFLTATVLVFFFIAFSFNKNK